MIKSDILFQLKLRLYEVKQTISDVGGIHVSLFDDLMQLQPVRSRCVFAEPSSTAKSLLDLFHIVELKTNYRQGNNHAYADILNRIRIGMHA